MTCRGTHSFVWRSTPEENAMCVFLGRQEWINVYVRLCNRSVDIVPSRESRSTAAVVQRMAMFKTRLVCLCLVSTVVLSLLLFAVPHLHSDNADDAAGASPGADVERRRSKFLVDTPGCKIPDIDPFDLSIRSMVTADNVSVVCNATPPMTYAML